MISEPMTLFTDCLIILVAGWFGLRRLASGRECNSLSQQAWGIAFLFVGLGALFGGTFHGFGPQLSDAWEMLLWKGVVYSIGFSMLFAVAGTLRGTPISIRTQRTLNAANLLAFSAYAFWMIKNEDFEFVILYYVPAMLLIAGVQTWALIRHQLPGAKWLVGGVIVTLVSSYIQQSDIDLHRNFNHNDLYHVVQIAGLYLLHRGAMLLVDHNPDSQQDSSPIR